MTHRSPVSTTRNVTSRGVSYKCTKFYGWVHAKCSGILNAAQYRRKSDWTCDACSAPQSQLSPPPTRYIAPPTKQISDDSTFNVLQLNANGIGNKLTELEVVFERNKVKVVVIQESTKSKNPCIQNYTTVRRNRSHGQGGLLIIPVLSQSVVVVCLPRLMEGMGRLQFSDLFTELPVPPQAAGVVATF